MSALPVASIGDKTCQTIPGSPALINKLKVKYLEDVRNFEKAYWPQRRLNDNNASWKLVSQTVRRNGHDYCTLIRDNWACWGDRYEAVLRETRPYNKSKSLGKLKAGTRILVDGNSFT